MSLITLKAPDIDITPSQGQVRDLEDRYQRRYDRIASDIVDTAKDRTPVKTGRLRSSYRLQLTSFRDHNTGGVQILNATPYFRYVEYGTRRPRGPRMKIPMSRISRKGRFMLSSSIDDHENELRQLEDDYSRDFEQLIGVQEN